MIKIYTDGSSIGNPGPGGWAILVLQESEKNKSNNRSTQENQKRNGKNIDTNLTDKEKTSFEEKINIDGNQLSELKKPHPGGVGHIASFPQSLFPIENEIAQCSLENKHQKTHNSLGSAISFSGSEQYTTNNRMELVAVISAFLYIQQYSLFDEKIVVYMDSKYVHDGLEQYLDQWVARGWRLANKKPVQNIDLWKQLYTLKNSVIEKMNSRGGVLQRKRVKAHHIDTYNNFVDRLAREQATGF